MDFMEELIRNNPTIAKMAEYEKAFRSASKLMRQYWESEAAEYALEESRRLECEQAYSRGKRKGRKEGREKGLAEGRKENALEMARRLRCQGILSVEQIAEALDLPVKTVKALHFRKLMI